MWKLKSRVCTFREFLTMNCCPWNSFFILCTSPRSWPLHLRQEHVGRRVRVFCVWGDGVTKILGWPKMISHGRYFYLYPSMHFPFYLLMINSLHFSWTHEWPNGNYIPQPSFQPVSGNATKCRPVGVWGDGLSPLFWIPLPFLMGLEYGHGFELFLCVWWRRWWSNKLQATWILEWCHGTQLPCQL